MVRTELLEGLRQLSPAERLAVLEMTLRLVQEDLQQTKQPTQAKRKRQLTAAAKALLPDYAPGGELTVFTALDGEDFYA